MLPDGTQHSPGRRPPTVPLIALPSDPTVAPSVPALPPTAAPNEPPTSEPTKPAPLPTVAPTAHPTVAPMPNDHPTETLPVTPPTPPTQLRRALHVVQYNIGSWRAAHRRAELLHRLDDWGTDVVALQETHLAPADDFLVKGWVVAARADRRAPKRAGEPTAGGGCMILVRPYVEFHRHDPTIPPEDTTTDVCGVRLFFHGNSIAHLVTAYVPPIRTSQRDPRVQHFDPATLAPRGITDPLIVAADVNAHHPAWDDQANPCTHGEALQEWFDEIGLIPQNTGAPTRWAGARGTAPDVTAVPAKWDGATDWHTEAPCGSDHRPILFEIPLPRVHSRSQPPRPPPRSNFAKADWPAYQEATERRLSALLQRLPHSTVSDAAHEFTRILQRSSHQAIPHGNGRPNARAWWNEEVEQATATRNAAIREHQRNPTQHTAACARTTAATAAAAIRAAKTDHWRCFAATVSPKTNPALPFRVCRALEGKRPSTSRAALLDPDDAPVTDPGAQAELFLREYVAAATCPTYDAAAERLLEREEAAALRAPSPPPPPISPIELETALRQLVPGKAPGPDGVHPEHLTHLGAQGRECLLQILQTAWSTATVPPMWRQAILVPILKPGRPPSRPGSYRPIALTSVVAKLLERIVHARLMHHLEGSDGQPPRLSACQAGFRSGRSAEEQVAASVQWLYDGVTARWMAHRAKGGPARRAGKAALVSFDQTRAFDKVWRWGLYRQLRRMDVDPHTVRFLHAFLHQRTAAVRCADVVSRPQQLRQGVPQGTVLGPVMYLVYIDSLACAVRSAAPTVRISLYADDLVLLSRSDTLDDCRDELQPAVTAVCEWSRQWRTQLSAEKTVCASFTTNVAERHNRTPLNLYLDPDDPASQITFTEHPKILGVTLDQELHFNEHAATAVRRATKRQRLLRALAGTTWGAETATLRTIHRSYVESAFCYALPGWASYASAATLRRLQTVQNTSAALITGCIRSTPQVRRLREAGLLPVSLHLQRTAAYTHERFRRLPPDTLANEVATANPPSTQRRARAGARTSWRSVATSTIQQTPLRSYPCATPPPVPPPYQPHPRPRIHTRTLGNTPKTASPTVRLQAALAEFATLPDTSYELWTDGSANRAAQTGGAGFLLVTPDGESEGSAPVDVCASSYAAEWAALLEGMRTAHQHRAKVLLRTPLSGAERPSLRVLTDSLSSLTRLQNPPEPRCPTKELQLRHLLATWPGSITLHHVPAHVGLQRNEAADGLAQQAASEAGPGRNPHSLALDLSDVRGALRHYVTNQWPPPNTEGPLGLLPSTWSPPKLPPSDPPPSRRVSSYASQLCTGHCSLLTSWLHRVQPDRTASPHCPRCGAPDDDARHFVQDCPAHTAARMAAGIDTPAALTRTKLLRFVALVTANRDASSPHPHTGAPTAAPTAPPADG